MTALLEAVALHRSFGRTPALAGLSLAVRPGEVYGLVGPDGAGKTTALRLLVGLMTPTAGEALLHGEPALRSRRREAIGYVPQGHGLYGDLSVGENLDFFAALHRLQPRAYAERRAELLATTELARFVDRRAEALSGGMYKKLALACALLHRPELIVLDEPTTGVDPISRAQLWDLLRARVRDGMAALVSTSYMDEAAQCDRVGLLLRGRLIEEGTPRELLERFEHVVYTAAGGDRDELLRALEDQAGVVAVAPSGGGLRLIALRGAEATLAAHLERHRARLQRCASRFDDVYLARMRASGE